MFGSCGLPLRLGPPRPLVWGKNHDEASTKDLIYNFKNFEKGGGKSVVKKQAMMLRTAGQNCELVENVGADKVLQGEDMRPYNGDSNS